MGGRVPISAVIVWRDAREDIAGALGSLEGPLRAAGGEAIVVGSVTGPAWSAARAAFPGVDWIRVGPDPESDRSVTLRVSPGCRGLVLEPVLRAGFASRVRGRTRGTRTAVSRGVPYELSEAIAWREGFERARGETIAFGAAGGRFGAGWVAAILDARAGGAEVVAGPVGFVGGSSLAERCAFLCDYWSVPEGSEGRGAAACNVAFARRVLDEGWREDGLHKCLLLRPGRRRVAWRREMAVTLAPVHRFGEAALARFRRGRHYASLRAAGWPRPLRWLAGLACPALPIWLLVKMLRGPGVVGRWGGTLLLGAPWIAAALGTWALGEWAGYWFGGPSAWMPMAKGWACWWSGPDSSARGGRRRPSRRGGRGSSA